MLDLCFAKEKNVPPMLPKATRMQQAPNGLGFESRAFATLFRNRAALRITSIWRCKAARVDGYLETLEGEIILLEMKERLGWGAIQAAGFQFLTGKTLLKIEANRGLIIFERMADEWSCLKPYGAWGQLALHASEFSEYFEIGGLNIRRDGSLHPPSLLNL